MGEEPRFWIGRPGILETTIELVAPDCIEGEVGTTASSGISSPWLLVDQCFVFPDNSTPIVCALDETVRNFLAKWNREWRTANPGDSTFPPKASHRKEIPPVRLQAWRHSRAADGRVSSSTENLYSEMRIEILPIRRFGRWSSRSNGACAISETRPEDAPRPLPC